MRLDIEVSSDPLLKDIREHRQKVMRAGMWAANRTARDIQEALVGEMRRKFYKATPFILGSLETRFAKQSGEEAVVDVRPWRGSNNPARVALEAQVFGGSRPYKRSEIRLGLAGPGGSPVYMLPANIKSAYGVKYDANGNPSRGQLTQILADIGVLNQGDNTRSRKGRRKRKRKTEYFAIWGRGEGFGLSGNALSPGIYRKAPGGRPIPVYVFMKGAPSYRKRLDWFGVARSTFNLRAQANFDSEMARPSTVISQLPTTWRNAA